MKKKHKIMIIIIIVLIIADIIMFAFCINLFNHIRIDKIIDIWSNNNITYIETSDGNIWAMDKINNIKGNTLVFDTLGTNTIYDDIIINIK